MTEVFAYLEMLSTKILDRTFKRFPRLIDDVNEFVSKFLNEVNKINKINLISLIVIIININLNIILIAKR